MTKESKKLGISRPCPECRKTLIAAAQIVGTGKFKTKCPHCETLILVEFGQKTFFNVSKVVAIILLIIICLGSISYVEAIKKNCNFFKTKLEAQIAYNDNPKNYASLDRDKDGRVCESL